MSQPEESAPALSIEERVAAMEANLAGWEEWRAQAVARFTAVETTVAQGAARLTTIEANVTPALQRLAALESSGGQVLQALSEAQAAVGQIQAALGSLETRLSALGQVARPGRTVIRGQVDQLLQDVAELKANLPTEGGTE